MMTATPGSPWQHARALMATHRRHRLGWCALWPQALGLLMLLVAVALGFSQHAAVLEVLATMRNQPWLPITACAWCCAALAQRRRRRFRHAFTQSWLAALPSRRADPDRAQAWTVLRPGVGVVIAVALWARVLAGDDSSYNPLLLMLVVAAVIGSGLGWCLAAREPKPAKPRPRHLPRRSNKKLAGLTALAHWPLRQAWLNADPAWHARTLGVLLLLAPAGTPLRYGVAALLIGASALLWLELARGLLQSIPAAADALRSLHLPRMTFARVMCMRTLILAVAVGVIVLVALPVLGVAPAQALGFVLAGIGTVHAAALIALVGDTAATRAGTARTLSG